MSGAFLHWTKNFQKQGLGHLDLLLRESHERQGHTLLAFRSTQYSNTVFFWHALVSVCTGQTAPPPSLTNLIPATNPSFADLQIETRKRKYFLVLLCSWQRSSSTNAAGHVPTSIPRLSLPRPVIIFVTSVNFSLSFCLLCPQINREPSGWVLQSASALITSSSAGGTSLKPAQRPCHVGVWLESSGYFKCHDCCRNSPNQYL